MYSGSVEVDLWELHKQGKIVCIPTNGVVTNGKLVMGKGVARTAAYRYRALPYELATRIRANGLRVEWLPDCNLYTFPTKHKWWNPSSLTLIVDSARQLMVLIEVNGHTEVYLPKPGCGAGGLRWEEVSAAISPILDQRVTIVWK
jgi:hypothetical protein